MKRCPLILSFSIMASLAAWLAGCGKTDAPQASTDTLRVLCGNSMSAPVEELGKLFAEQNGVKIEYDLGGSETLLPKILAGARADIFVCHDPFEDKLKAAKRWTSSAVVGYLEPALAVHPGNPKGIKSLADLGKPGLKIGIGDPRYSTCGELFVKALRDQNLYDPVMKNVALQGRSHSEIANGLIVGPLDAVVVWNFVIPMNSGKLEIVPTGIKYPVTRITIAGLTSSENPKQRDAYLEWCRQPAVQEIFGRHGYRREGQ